MWLQCVAVGAVWGLTNAWMKQADARYSKKESDHILVNLITNWQWLLAFAANQSGSVLFYLTLRDADLSFAVPVCQATTLMFTTLGAVLLGEGLPGDLRWTALGILFVSMGIAIMRAAEEEHSQKSVLL